MAEEFVFRKGTKADCNAIARLILQNYNVKSLEDAKSFFEKDFSQGMNYVVAGRGSKLAGFATWKEHDRPYHELAELHAIAVDDAFKGKGLSKTLFEKLVADLNLHYSSFGHSLRKLYVLAHANNARAIRYYEKMGFKKEAVIPNHYYNGIDELVLSIYFR